MTRGRRAVAARGAQPGRRAARSDRAEARPLLALSMIVRNEDANLRRLLPPIRDLFDEVVVADTGSTDGTVPFLESIGARVVSFPWRDDFAAARNASLERTTARWVLWLDADDAVSREAAEQLRALASASPPKTAYFLELENAGTRAEEVSVCNQLRLFPNVHGASFEGRIHEQIALGLKRLGVSFARAPIRVVHRGYLDPETVRAKFERNLRILKEEATSRPDDPFVQYHLAQTCVGLGRPSEALAALAALAARGWGDGVEREMALQGRVLAARLRDSRGDAAGARAELEAALAEEPSHGLARLFLAQVSIAAGERARAVELLEPLVFGDGLKPGVLPYPVAAANETAALLLADALLGLKRGDLAEAALERARLGGTRGVPRLLRFGVVAQSNGLLDIALKAFSRAAKEAPDAFEPHFLIGTLLMELRRLDEAERSLAAALAIRPDAPEALVNLANAALARGDHGRAEALYRKAIAANPGSVLAQENLAKVLLLTKRGDEAIPILERLVAQDPSRADLLAHAGDVHLGAARAGDAIRCYEASLVARPRSAPTWTLLGDAYARLGARGAAETAWRRALAVAPSHALARARLGAPRPGTAAIPAARG